MMKFLLLIFLLINISFGADTKDINEVKLKKMISHMLLVGFDTLDINETQDIYKYIKEYELGGVILFDKHYNNRALAKNIKNPIQLKKLTQKLQNISPKKLIISVDQEGGKVARLKEKDGFLPTYSAWSIAKKHDDNYAQKIYTSLATELKEYGFNCDFAPVVDLALNKDNKVIFALQRSYGATTDDVVRNANIFMKALRDNGVLSVLKHFPGHGSSLSDSHKGFVDISDTWNVKEIEPYAKLIKMGNVQMIMTAHVFNRNLDELYPATLSYAINTKLLREKMAYDGVIISDDMQMKAISAHYSLDESVRLCINSGVDILLFANQLASQDTGELIESIYKQVKNKAIPLSRIIESNKRIAKLLEEI